MTVNFSSVDLFESSGIYDEVDHLFSICILCYCRYVNARTGEK